MTAALEISIEVFTRYSTMNSMLEKENASEVCEAKRYLLLAVRQACSLT